MVPRPTENEDEAGFTLLELLVSLSLVAMMATFALSTLQRFSDLRRLELVVSKNERLQSAERHLRQTLSGLRFARLSDVSGENAYLVGEEDRLWIANVLDDQLVPGRLNILRYEVLGDSLVLRQGTAKSVEATSDTVSLLKGVSKIRLSFLNPGVDGSESSWQSMWSKNHAPSGVRILIESQDGDQVLPPFVIPVETSGTLN